MWALDPLNGSLGMVRPRFIAQRLVKADVPMQRAPRVGLEALTIARGTSALGPACSNKSECRQRFLPLLAYWKDFGSCQLSYSCPTGGLTQVGQASSTNHTPPFSIPALNVGLDPLPAGNYLAVFQSALLVNGCWAPPPGLLQCLFLWFVEPEPASVIKLS
jgi:hypothetical protein